MTPNPSTHAPDLAAGRLARGDADTGETAAAPSHMKERSQPASRNLAPRTGAATVEERHERRRRRSTSPTTRRLGLIDCTLLALIALGVAITVAMAIVNP